MSQEQFPHIFLQSSGQSLPYSNPIRGGGSTEIPQRNRRTHSQYLKNRFEQAWERAKNRKENREAASLDTKDGVYLEFRSKAGADLVTKSLESIRSGVRLLNVRIESGEEGEITIATVYVPAGKESLFLEKIRKYAEEETKSGQPKNKRLINSIEDIRLAILESFWQSDPALIPDQTPSWCELWLRQNKDESPETVFEEMVGVCEKLGIEVKRQTLSFPERLVILIHANRDKLLELIESSNRLAELREAKKTARYWIDLEPRAQDLLVTELSGRLELEGQSNVTVCVLDTGVNNGHTLISPVLHDDDRQTFDPSWGVNDHDGHGTGMSGLAAFRNIQELLSSNAAVRIRHKLESVKILPPRGENDPDLYGYITQQAISRAEIQGPQRKRVICMAITEDGESHRGRPSSWSAAIDAAASGAEDNKRRLIVISAGNIVESSELRAYPSSNETSSIYSPGQSWNALTVGAYTELTTLTDPNLSGYRPLASAGGLSPFSRTSMTWEQRKWPIKPDILLEGGNGIIDDMGCYPL